MVHVRLQPSHGPVALFQFRGWSRYVLVRIPRNYSEIHYLQEERLYWVLNNAYQHGKPRLPKMRPTEAAEVSGKHLQAFFC